MDDLIRILDTTSHDTAVYVLEDLWDDIVNGRVNVAGFDAWGEPLYQESVIKAWLQDMIDYLKEENDGDE